MKILISLILLLMLTTIGCQKSYKIGMSVVNDKVWYECTYHVGGFYKRQLAICETLEKCQNVCRIEKENLSR